MNAVVPVIGFPDVCPECKATMPRSAYATAQLAMGHTLIYNCPCSAALHLLPLPNRRKKKSA